MEINDLTGRCAIFLAVVSVPPLQTNIHSENILLGEIFKIVMQSAPSAAGYKDATFFWEEFTSDFIHVS